MFYFLLLFGVFVLRLCHYFHYYYYLFEVALDFDFVLEAELGLLHFELVLHYFHFHYCFHLNYFLHYFLDFDFPHFAHYFLQLLLLHYLSDFH